MLIIFIRAIIIYVFLLIAMRLMGKKQLGELQPFEFAISLIVADLACIPMGDTSVPITYGLIPIFTLFVLHLFVTKIVKHNLKLRGFVNGHPIVVITPRGIDYEMLTKLDMTMSDLLEALRGQGYFSPSEVEYAIVETCGSLSVMPKASVAPMTISDIDAMNGTNKANQISEDTLPITLITEGKKITDNIVRLGLSSDKIADILSKNHLEQKDVLLMTIRDREIYISPVSGDSITLDIDSLCDI